MAATSAKLAKRLPLRLERGEGWGEVSIPRLRHSGLARTDTLTHSCHTLAPIEELEPLGIRVAWEVARRTGQRAKAAWPTERARRSQRRKVCRSRERQVCKLGKAMARASGSFDEAEGPARPERIIGWASETEVGSVAS